MTWLDFTIAALVVYRLSLMTALESGPGRIFREIRNIPEPKSATREGITCIHCTSIYHAALVTAFLWWRDRIESWDAPLWWLALSGVAICLHHQFTSNFKK